MANTILLSEFTAVGDAVLDQVGAGGSSERGHIQWSNANTPDYGDDDWLIVGCFVPYNASSDLWVLGFYDDGSNYFGLRASSTANVDSLEFFYRDGGSGPAPSILDSAITSGGSRQYCHCIRYAVMCKSGDITLYLVDSEGNVIKNTASGTASWGDIHAKGATFQLGAREPSNNYLEGLVGPTFAIKATTTFGTISDADMKQVILNPGQFLTRLAGVDTDSLWSINGNVRASSGGAGLDRTEWTNLSTAHRVHCPYQDAEGTIVIEGAETPRWRTEHEIPSRQGGGSLQSQNAPYLIPHPTDTTRLLRPVIGQGPNDDAMLGYQWISATTGWAITPVVPLQVYSQASSDSSAVREAVEAATEYHNSLVPVITDDSLLFFPAFSNGVSGGNYDTCQVLTLTDTTPENTVAFVDVGGGSVAANDISYMVRSPQIGDHVLLATRRSERIDGQLVCLRVDVTDNSIDVQTVTGAPSGGTAYDGSYSLGIADIGGGQALVTWTPTAETDKSYGLGGAIVDVASFTTEANWYAANTGSAADITLGTTRAEDDDLQIIRDNVGVAYASQDDIRPANILARNGTLLLANRIDTGNLDAGAGLTIDALRLDGHTVSSNTVGAATSQDITSIVSGASGEPFTAAEFAAQLHNATTALYWGRSSGTSAIAFVASQGGETMDATAGGSKNAVHFDNWWGTELYALTIPDASNPSASLYGTKLYDTAGSDAGLSVRPLHEGNLVNGQYLPIEVMSSSGRNATDGDGVTVIRMIDVSQVVAELPVGSSRAARAVRSRTLGVRGVRDVA